MKKKKIGILISGRGSNMEAIINNVQHEKGCLKDCCEIAVIFSNNMTAKGLDIAKKNNIKTITLDPTGLKRSTFDQKILDVLKPYQLDYIVLAGYMRILSPTFTKAYSNKIINIHPADTQRHKGLHAYEWAFNNKLQSTKITVHLVDEGVDTGQILGQKKVDLNGVKTLEEVEKRGLKVEHQFYSQVLAELFAV